MSICSSSDPGVWSLAVFTQLCPQALPVPRSGYLLVSGYDRCAPPEYRLFVSQNLARWVGIIVSYITFQRMGWFLQARAPQLSWIPAAVASPTEARNRVSGIEIFYEDPGCAPLRVCIRVRPENGNNSFI